MTLALLARYFENDPVMSMLKPPERPAIRNIYCVYGPNAVMSALFFCSYMAPDLGINMPTEIGYRYEVIPGSRFSLADVYAPSF